MNFPVDITTVSDSLNCLHQAVSEIVNESEFQQKWEAVAAVEVKDVAEEFAQCYNDETKTDAEIEQ